MNKATIGLASLGVGAGIMYLADPQDGKRRRARLRDAIAHTWHSLEAASGTAARDTENRFAGVAARTLRSLLEAPPPTDEVLTARVRARIGRLVSHPGAIDVEATAGAITLSGPVFEVEVGQLVEGVREVAGVTRVENHLEPHAQAGDVSALQGPGPLKVDAAASWRRWTPTTRMVAGAGGVALMALASRYRTVRGAAVGVAGFELLEQALRAVRGA